MNDYLAMGGYAAYVWSAYGAFAGVFLLNISLALRQGRRVRTHLKKTIQTSIERQVL